MKGYAFGKLGRSAQEIVAVYEDFLERYLDAEASTLRIASCAVLAAKVLALGAIDDFELALRTFSDLDRRFVETACRPCRHMLLRRCVRKA